MTSLPHEAEQVLANEPLDLGIQYHKDEERIQFIGETDRARILIVVITFRGRPDQSRDCLQANKGQPHGLLPFQRTGVMLPPKNIPVFASEAEQAGWWFNHRENFAQDFKQALAEGTVRRGTLSRLENVSSSGLQLDPEDITHAHLLAKKEGH